MTRYAPQAASRNASESSAPGLDHHSALRPIPTAVRLACGTLLAGGMFLQAALAQTAPAETMLPKVTVNAKQTRADDLPPAQPGGLTGSGARLGLLGNQDAMDTPFNLTSYTAKLIEDQQAKTVADVLNNDPSVRFTTSGAHAYENFRLRGFDVHGSDLAINGLYGLAPLGSSTLEFVERVEVLKGPSAMFTGMAPSGGIGGVINLVPKRAGDDPLTRVTLGYETESQLSTHLDVGRRFGADKAIGVRVNASYGDGETALQGQHKQRHLLSAALDYRGTALTASLDLYDSQLSFDGGSPAMYGFATTTVPKAPDPSVNYLKGAAGELQSKAAIARAEYAFSRDVMAFASVGTRKHDYSGWVNGTHAHSVQANGSALVRGVAQLGYDDGSSAELGTRLQFSTAGVRHELVLHATRVGLESGSLSNVTGMRASNIYDPITPTLPAMPTGSVPKGSESTLSSLALVDTLSFMKDAVRVTLGLRQQQVEQTGYNSSGAVNATYDEKALTPAVGVVVKPWGDGLSLYANHVQGLSKGDSVGDLNATNYGFVFKPYKTRQTELGIKWLAGGFMNTASLFQIDKPTMMSTGPSTSPTYTDGAETRVRGVEWNASGAVSSTVRVLGGLSYTKGELTKTQGGVNQGKEVFGVPHWQGNLGAQWDTPLSGLSLNARVIATSRQYLDSANTYQIPGSGQLDLGAAYSTKVAERKLVLRLNVDNAFDRHYWSGSFAEPRATLAAGRIVRASATMDF
jgi:iron complex outermembrane recepter protein